MFSGGTLDFRSVTGVLRGLNPACVAKSGFANARARFPLRGNRTYARARDSVAIRAHIRMKRTSAPPSRAEIGVCGASLNSGASPSPTRTPAAGSARPARTSSICRAARTWGPTPRRRRSRRTNPTLCGKSQKEEFGRQIDRALGVPESPMSTRPLGKERDRSEILWRLQQCWSIDTIVSYMILFKCAS